MTLVGKRCVVVGAGRLGGAITSGLLAADIAVSGPLGRGADGVDADVVLLCVPDAEITAAAQAVTPRDGLLVGHCSGATTLEPLAPHEAFSLHPLMTVTGAGTDMSGAPAAIAGSTAAAVAIAGDLARALGLKAFEVADEDRAAYHAGASIASNFLVTLEWMATRVGGLEREQLAPLVRASVDNWERLGPEAALTGPVARDDEQTIEAQRHAVSERAPDLLPVFDELVEATRTLASTRAEAVA
jgi:predicted short-subunit dehydrogenase-like oxidoreductase (DUF2520 family)